MAYVDLETLNNFGHLVEEAFPKKEAVVSDIASATSGLASYEWVKENFIASAGISASGSTITIEFYNGNGASIDSVSFTIN